MSAYYRMETIEHFAKISLVARTLGREHLLSRDEVERLQGLRGMYGIASPAPICTDDDAGAGGRRPAGMPGRPGAGLGRRAAGARDDSPDCRPDPAASGDDGEIRLTYRELTALIEDAVRI